ncbi:MAG: HYR domain-containing protein, partial [Saprospiraceae bacterium]|nr:HYR domain-containing protein [Saprospiraceae bacterium]
MKNYLHCPVRPIWLILAVCLMSVTSVYSRNAPQPETSRHDKISSNPQAAPVFVDLPPNDTIVDCADNVPAPVGLMATDDTDPTFPKTIMPTDFPDPGTIDPCEGATIIRTWMAIDQDNDTAMVTQTIVVLPDTEGPEVSVPEIQETQACQVFNYGVWINSQRLRVATNSTDNCSGIDDISDDAPPSFDDPCGMLTVTFTLLDNCGNTTQWQAMVSVIDTIVPEMTGLPSNVTISCSDPIPPVPHVTVTDNCTSSLVPTFVETNTQVMDSTCAQYEYSIVRTWTVSDSCGNEKSHTQVIAVDDFTAPTFTVPQDITINCSDDPQNLTITGNATNVVDNCDPDPEIFYTDVVQSGSCPGNSIIVRTWRSRDVCGNVTGKIQTITVVDDESPDFVVPGDITVNCDDANDDDLTGEPTNVTDNCDNAPVVSFTDVVVSGPCVNSYSIRRTWKATDVCGNFTEKDQIITIVDNVAPVLGTTAANLTLNCTEGINVQGAFDAWVNDLGGANASDNCTEDQDLVWYAFNSGTNDPASLPINNCPAPGGVIRTRMVDFIVEDECGNRDTTTATFKLIDNVAPIISACPENVTVATNAGLCEATYVLLPPVIEENCADTTLAINLTGSAPITANAQPGQEGDTPVNPVFINLNVPIPAPVNALGSGTLTIELVSADAEETTEFFNIYGEAGTFLGTTMPTPAQCGNSTTFITLSASQINNWAQDGVIVISLQPNTAGGLLGRFYINAICNPAGTVNAELDFTAKNFGALTFEYSINGGGRTAVVPIGPRSISLDPGDHLITYYATDCGGNVDSCSYVVTVEDMEAPVSQCPSDILVNLAAGACTASVTLPLPAGATDNCGVYNRYEQTLPADTAAAWLTFAYDPNLNDYIANEELFIFNGLAANAFAPVTLQLDLRGDFVDNNAFLTIYGDDNSVVGLTQPGVSNCATAGQVSFNIPATTFNAWAADGTVQFRVQPFDVPVPPGVPGDGVNPCNSGVVDATGEVDSVSYVFATLVYNRLTPTYFAQGATTIPPTVMQSPGILPTHVFNLGETEVFYVITDLAGNTDTCSFQIIVEDNEAPMVSCQPAFLFINPSGMDVQTLDVSDVDLGSTDNCTIVDRFITPNTFTCAQIGSIVNITLTVVDGSGNSATCNTIAAITAEGPMPTANSGLCGGDTLFLFANPPVGTYTYRWFNPSGMLISTQQNPVVLGISPAAEGPYRVEIRGVTGCTAEGVVTVSIEDLPVTPSLLTAASVCSVDNIVLNSSIFPMGNNVLFSWYQGLPPNGVLIGTTNQPTLTIPGPHPIGANNYYLTVEANGCLSAPSNPVNVAAVAKPVASVSFTDTLVCAGTTVNLGTPVVGAGITY